MSAGQKRVPDLIRDGCEPPPRGCWQLNSGPLDKQPVLLTTEQSLQLPVTDTIHFFVCLFVCCCCCCCCFGLNNPKILRQNILQSLLPCFEAKVLSLNYCNNLWFSMFSALFLHTFSKHDIMITLFHINQLCYVLNPDQKLPKVFFQHHLQIT